MKNYTVQSVKNLRAGDTIKITRRTVTNVAKDEMGQTVLTFNNGSVGVFFGTERVGVYR